MRAEKIRIGTKVLINRYKRRLRPTSPRRRGTIIRIGRTLGKRARYVLSIKTAEGVITRREDQVRFAALPVVPVRDRRTIWIRKDIAGDSSPAQGVFRPPFHWGEPLSGERSQYRAYDLHISHISKLRAMERQLEELEGECGEMRKEFHGHLRFLKEEGAVPVDMMPVKPRTGDQPIFQEEEERNDCDGQSAV